MEAFYTIQGEGTFQGSPAFFIRLGGCDVGCSWCDVKDSWDVSRHPVKNIKEIVGLALENPSRMSVITGGEPLMYDLTSLTDELKKNGFRTHLETSGAYPLTGSWDWICLSPKKFKQPIEKIFQQADELKVIIYNKSDFSWAEQNMKMAGADCKLYLQPEWGKMNRMMKDIIHYVKEHPQWKISLQVHKFMNIP